MMPLDPDLWHKSGDVTFRLPNDVCLKFSGHLDGGGTLFADDIVHAVKTHGNKKHYQCAFEWCAGPAVIGFQLLAEQLAEHMVCSDYYSVAIDSVISNAKRNNLESRVTGYVSPTISSIPSVPKWDLVVGNPPHCFSDVESIEQEVSRTYDDPLARSNNLRILADPDMQTHRDFFTHIREKLTDDADVFIYEQSALNSEVRDKIQNLAHAGGLKIQHLYPLQMVFERIKNHAPWIDPAIHQTGGIYHFTLA